MGSLTGDRADRWEPGGLVYSLPQTIVTVSADADATTGRISYTVTPTIMPDGNARFRLRYAPTGFSDDTINIAVDEFGLLTTADATFVGEAGKVLTSLAEGATRIATGTRLLRDNLDERERQSG